MAVISRYGPVTGRLRCGLYARSGVCLVGVSIPPKSNRSDPICFSPYLYRARNQVERFFNRIKRCRRVAARYDRLAANYLAFVQLAAIRLRLRLNESPRPYRGAHAFRNFLLFPNPRLAKTVEENVELPPILVVG